jgi:hypothetical protein
MYCNPFQTNKYLLSHIKCSVSIKLKKPSETMFEPFAEFCESMSIPVLVVPAGFDLSPPQSNSNDGDEEDEDVMSVEDALDSISNLLDQEEDSAATTVIVDDEIDSWG